MSKREPKPRKLRWNGKPAFCVWDGIGVGLSMVLILYPIWIFLMMVRILPAPQDNSFDITLGVLSGVLTVVGFGYFLARWKRMLKVTSAFVMVGVILCMILLLFFFVYWRASMSIEPYIHEKLYGDS